MEGDAVVDAESDLTSGRSVFEEVKENDARSLSSGLPGSVTTLAMLTFGGALVVVDVVVVVVVVLSSDGGSDQIMITGSSSEGLPDSGPRAAGSDFAVVVGEGVVVVVVDVVVVVGAVVVEAVVGSAVVVDVVDVGAADDVDVDAVVVEESTSCGVVDGGFTVDG